MNDNDFLNMISTPEELHPELKKHLSQGRMFEVLQHPLVYSVPYTAALNALHNKQFELKKELLKQAISKKDFHKAVYLHERPWRLQAFYEYEENMSDDVYWKLLGGIWVDTENFFQNAELWHEMITSERPGRHNLMDADEIEILKNLPKTMTIYRGTDLNVNSMSWTRNLKTARWFAKRCQGRVYRAKVHKEQIIAYFGGRNEQEIVVDPSNLKIMKKAS